MSPKEKETPVGKRITYLKGEWYHCHPEALFSRSSASSQELKEVPMKRGVVVFIVSLSAFACFVSVAGGADKGVPAGSFPPPLWMAAFECKVDAVRLLLERGVDVNVRHKGVTPLMMALGSPYSQVEPKRCQECARLMLDKGADINATATSDDGGTDKGLTPLMIATSGGNTDIMKMLLDSGADANASTANGETAVMMAARRGLLEAIKLLSATGANINARNAEGENALMRAFDAKRFGVECVDTVKYLVGSGADVNASDKFGWTPLMKACSNRVPEAAKILVEAGADVNVCSPADNQTPLRLATQEGLSEIVQLLKARGAKE